MPTPSERVLRRLFLARGYASCQVPTTVGRMHYLIARGHGDLPPMVTLHGFAASGVQLAPVLRFFRPAVQRVMAVDLPGHGFSEVPRGVLEPAAILDGVFQALDDIIREPVVLFGNSMGGYIAARYAMHAPHNVSKLVLVSPGGAQMDQRTLDEMRKVFHIDSHGDAVEFIDRLLGKRSKLRHVLAVSVRRRLSRGDLIALLDAVKTDELFAAADLDRLTMPVLCVWGKEDEILPRANLEFFRTHLPAHAQIVEPERFGHSPYLEAPRGLSRLVLDFVRRPSNGVII